MKTLKTLVLLLLAGITAMAQTIVSDNNTAVLLTPEGIQIKPDSNYNDSNLGLGTGALQKNSGNNNTAYGSSALSNTTSSVNNTAIGANTLISLVNGEDNTAVGAHSQSFASGSRNTSVGTLSMEYGSEANDVTAIGYGALRNNTYSGNTAVGAYALEGNTDGKFQTAVGFEAMRNHTNRFSIANTAVGYQAMKNNVSGIDNTALGSGAMADNPGDRNIAIGVETMASSNASNYNIAIGNKAMQNAGDIMGTVAIGTNSAKTLTLNDILYIDNNYNDLSAFQNKPLIGGRFKTGSGEQSGRVVGINRLLGDLLSRTETLQVEGEAFKTIGGGNWITTSDRRLKEKIQSLNADEVLQKVLSLQGVNYEWKDKTKGEGIQYGFIAQDLQKVFPTKVQENKNGYLSASYGDFDPFLVEAIKALQNQLTELQSRLTATEEEMAALKASAQKFNSK